MSDDFDDDSFMVDDSFLAEIDNITATASTSVAPVSKSNAPLPGNNNAKALTAGLAHNRSAGQGPSHNGFVNVRKTFGKTDLFGESAGVNQTTLLPSKNAVAGPSKPSRPAVAHPPSDDFGEFDLPDEDLAMLDQVSAPTRSSGQTQPSSSSSARIVPIPSSRLGMGRSLAKSSSGSDGFQTHLNFRRENQSTKGKRWDRTIFAESGRRVDAAKIKAKGKARGYVNDDDDEVMSEEEDWGESLAPAPKPRVDPNQTYGPPKHQLDPDTRTTYVYPTNRPKRDYQYEIVRGCFTDNCLVALPTGLGKTFVAGVVMLNFYRWFPTGKIVFLAPTKPLVNQQIEACQLSCGIPSKDAAVMTGSSVSQKERAKLWAERRVFYCTPQTLDNDLKKGSVDPKDIVLAVFDEAHKASGSYAYTTILAYITAHHPHFRVLALTATPGADVQRVQSVVDALHISRIEIREAEAPEIRKYMNAKHTEKHCVAMGSIIEGFRDRWVAIMKPYVVKLVEKNILTDRDLDIKRLKPFRLTAKRMEIARDRTSNHKWCFGSLQQLERMARAMSHLLEFSLGMFRTALAELAGGQNAAGKKAGTNGGANGIRNNFEFQKLFRDVEAEMNLIRIGKDGRSKADRHPKMVKTLDLLLEHFQLADEDEKEHGVKNDTRAMVFCSFRDCVLEVVDMLNEHSGLLRATKFVGQSQGKQEIDKGFNQKEQKKTIQEFKEGKYNILVSTSIGEEGLDIGEVDFVVIYDMPKQSIKLLQRIGRTGRKRDGKVHVLMSENREDMNWDSAQQTHREIQEEILHSRNLELFEDVEPLLPLGKFPKCVEQEMPVDPWDPADQKVKRRLPGSQTMTTTTTTAKEKKSRGYEIPEDAHEGFVSVAQLLKQKGKSKATTTTAASKKRARSMTPVESDEEDDGSEDDEAENELLYGVVGKGKGVTKKVTSKAKSKLDGPTSKAKSTSIKVVKKPKVTQPKETKEEKKKRLEREESDRQAIDFFNTTGPSRRRLTTPPLTPPSFPSPPVQSRTTKTTHLPPSPITDESMEGGDVGDHAKTKLSPKTAALVGFSQLDAIDLSWEDDVDDDDDKDRDQVDDDGLLLEVGRQRPPPLAHTRSALMMPPPPVPAARPPTTSTSTSTSASPNLSNLFSSPFSLRPGPPRILSSVSPAEAVAPPSSESESPVLPARRGRHVPPQADPSPLAPRHRGPRQRQPPRQRQRADPERVNQLMDLDVEVSGSSQSADESSGEESESDRRFANDFQPTQAPRGYNQRAIYAAGLSTQAAPQQGLDFYSNQVARTRKEAFFAKARKPVLLTDSEGSENEYELGSFVCDDDASVDFDTQTHSDPPSYP